MNRVFADSFFYLALTNRADESHARAADLARALSRPVVTTDWVLTEVGDALAASRARADFPRLVRALRARADVEIVPFSRAVFDTALDLFESRADKQWPLTDCVSFVVMRERAMTDALTLTADHHVEQAGFRALMK